MSNLSTYLMDLKIISKQGTILRDVITQEMTPVSLQTTASEKKKIKLSVVTPSGISTREFLFRVSAFPRRFGLPIQSVGEWLVVVKKLTWQAEFVEEIRLRLRFVEQPTATEIRQMESLPKESTIVKADDSLIREMEELLKEDE